MSETIRIDAKPVSAGFLLATAGLTGALVMVIEVLGSRVIGPFFGVSLFVWTALITVTLLALAAGYAVGGHLADRHPDPAVLYTLIAAAGVLTALVPLIKAPVLVATLPLGLRVGALSSAAILFGPPLFLLGCVSPYVVRIAAHEWGRLGRTVGVFYSVSTAGSFVGTVGTGFFVIGYVGVNRALFLCGLGLVLIGAAYFVIYRRRWAAAAVPLLLLVLFPREQRPAVTMADGTRAQVVASVESHYGSLKVVDYRYGDRHTREMLIDGLVQGGVDMKDGRSIYEYSYLLEALPLAIRPDARSCLVIGLGAGVVPRWYEARGIDTEVVDINPEVVRIAQDYFGLRLKRPVVVEDARYFLATAMRQYDVIVLDVFSGDTTPGHLLSREALETVKARMTEGGVLAMNLVGSVHEDAEMTAAIVRTLGSLFAEVVVRPVFKPDEGAGSGNLVVIAADRGAAGAPDTLGEAVHPAARELVEHGLRNVAVVPGVAAAELLTDDFNPLDVRDLPVKERVRRLILESTHPDILLKG